MASAALRREERIGLVVALAVHAGLIALLVLRPSYAPVFQPPQRIEVTLSDSVGLTSTSPEPNADAAPDVAPELGETPAVAAVAEAQPEPLPKPVPKPEIKPAPRNVPQPQVKPAASKTAQLDKAIAQLSGKTPPKDDRKAGGSRIGSDFLKGVKGAQSTGTSQNAPAAAIGPAVKSSLAGAISRQLKPHWLAPQGADAEKLVTVLAWDLKPDGSLAGPPRVVGQDGITDANRAQAQRHAEQAVRAVQLAAPFELPPEYYNAWKRVASFRFDKRLSQ